jgi:hypothetical protein
MYLQERSTGQLLPLQISLLPSGQFKSLSSRHLPYCAVFWTGAIQQFDWPAQYEHDEDISLSLQISSVNNLGTKQIPDFPTIASFFSNILFDDIAITADSLKIINRNPTARNLVDSIRSFWNKKSYPV